MPNQSDAGRAIQGVLADCRMIDLPGFLGYQQRHE
jgi:hypothetical protein